MAISANLITAQIKQRANGQPFSAWNMSDLEGTRDAFLNWVYNLKTSGTTDKQREFGADFQRSPTTNFTIEELCLIWILVNDPAYLGLTESWADDVYIRIYQRAKFNLNVTERVTVLTNEIEGYKGLSTKNPSGIINPINGDATNPNGETIGTSNTTTKTVKKTGVLESIKAAFNSPLIWLLLLFSLFKIVKKRKTNEQ